MRSHHILASVTVLVAGLLCCLPSIAQPVGEECTAPAFASDGINHFDTTLATTSLVDSGCVVFPQYPIDLFSFDQWFCYTASCTGVTRFDVCGSSFDARIAVYDGCGCPQSNPLGCGYSGACCLSGGIWGEAFVSTVAGQAYVVRIGGLGPGLYARGPGTLTITPCPAPPANDSCVAAMPVNLGVVAFTTHGATSDGPPCGPMSGPDVWFAYTALGAGTVSFEVCSSNLDQFLAIYAGDTCGPALGPQLACAVAGASSPYLDPVQLVVQVAAGDQLLLQVGGWRGEGVLSIPCLTPCNDYCVNAEAVTDGEHDFQASGSTLDGPSCGAPVTRDVWSCYTATCMGMAQVRACLSQDNSELSLAAYDGCTCPAAAGNELACATVVQAQCSSQPGVIITFPVVSGHTYLIQLAAASSSAFQGQLSIQSDPPANDDCSAASVIGDGVTPFSTLLASTDGADLTGPCDMAFAGVDNQIHQDVWFCYQATCTGSASVEAEGFPLRIAAYDGCGCPGSAASVLSCIETTSSGRALSFCTMAGSHYLLRIGGRSAGNSGFGEITVTCAVQPTNDAAMLATPVGDGVIAYDLAGAMVDGPGVCASGVQRPDVWFCYTASCDGVARVTGCSTSVVMAAYAGCSSIPVSSDVLSCGCELNFPVVAGTSYLVQVAGYGAGQLTFSCVPCVMNDCCTQAAPIFDGTTAFDTTQAYSDGLPLGDGTCVSGPGSSDGAPDMIFHDVWFLYTATATGEVEASICAGMSSFSTRLAVYAGSSCPPTQADLLGCAGVVLPCLGSMVRFPTQAGQTYLIQVGGRRSSVFSGTGVGTISLGPACTDPYIHPTHGVLLEDGIVTLTWSIGEPYATLDLTANGVSLGPLAPTATQFFHYYPPPGDVVYELSGSCPNGGAFSISRTVAVPVPGAATDLILGLDGVDQAGPGSLTPGFIDSSTSLAQALEALGRSVAVLRGNFLAYPCLDELWTAADTIWVLTGTFPTNVRLTQDQGDALAGYAAAGKGIYFEGADHWGFQHVASTLDARDGIDAAFTLDGDDGFTSMTGWHALAAGLDLSAFVGVPYTQDSTGNDSTDRLALTTTDPVASAESIWIDADEMYVSGVIAVHMDGGVMISTSWEFGGFGGSTTALAGVYLVAFGRSVASQDKFIRGRCNSDSASNIADAVYLLGHLFPGSNPSNLLPCRDACDANDDGVINLADVIRLLFAVLFTPPVPLPPPGTGCGGIPGGCGIDITPDALDCQTFNPQACGPP